MASASSSSTSCTEVACEVEPTTAALPTVASPSNLVAVGRKLDRIHNTRPICWNKTIGNSRRADRWAVNVRCKLPLRRALWSEAMGSVRSEDPKNLNRQQQTARGPASPLRPLKRACWSDITIGGARPEPAACVAWVQNFPARLRRRTIACRRRVAFRQHLLEKLMSLQFAPLRGHVLIRKISPSRAWLCSMAPAGPLEATGS